MTTRKKYHFQHSHFRPRIEELKPGEVLIESTPLDMNTDRAKHLQMHFRIRPMPKPRETRKTRFVDARVKAYRSWANSVQETLKEALMTQSELFKGQFPIYPNGKRYHTLGIAFGFGAMKSAPMNAPLTKKGEVDKRYVKGVRDWDLSNLIKGVEDIFNGVVYDDDKQIRYYGPCFANDETSDWFSVHVFPSQWNDKWDKLTVYSILQWKQDSKTPMKVESIPNVEGQS